MRERRERAAEARPSQAQAMRQSCSAHLLSIRMALRFRAADRTLKDAEVNQTFNALLEKISAKEGYEIRQ